MDLDDDWSEVVGNIRNARTKCDRTSRISVGEEANTQVLGIFFKAGVQAILILGSEMWVMTPHTGKDLGGVPTQGDPCIILRHPHRLQDSIWE